MIESQTCKVEKVNIVAESNFVYATASGMSAGIQDEKYHFQRRTVHQAIRQSFPSLKILRLQKNSVKLAPCPLLQYHPSPRYVKRNARSSIGLVESLRRVLESLN
jgi:hypothetical protein